MKKEVHARGKSTVKRMPDSLEGPKNSRSKSGSWRHSTVQAKFACENLWCGRISLPFGGTGYLDSKLAVDK
jgi:hypothetical protein